MNTVHNTIPFIEALGIPIASTSADDDDYHDDGYTDGYIELADGRHIQIGDEYFLVYGAPPEGAILGPRLAEIEGTNLNDLRLALQQKGGA